MRRYNSRTMPPLKILGKVLKSSPTSKGSVHVRTRRLEHAAQRTSARWPIATWSSKKRDGSFAGFAHQLQIGNVLALVTLMRRPVARPARGAYDRGECLD